MPDKLTDSEIVKALEICGTYKGKCTDCPAFVKVDRSNCKNVLLGAVEIINRQNADLIDKEKQLQDALKSMAVNKTKVIDCEKEINRLQAENERLSTLAKLGNTRANDYRVMRDRALKAEAENERLKNDLAISKKETKRYMTGYKTTKAEAYKECIEKVDKELSLIRRKCKNNLDDEGVFAIDRARKKIDNLLKKLVGEDK